MNKPINPKRQAILNAAKQSFIAHGYSGTSMEAIAEAAPVSKPTLYNHFKSKEELFAAVIAAQCQSLLTTFSDVHTEYSNPVVGLTAIAESFADLVYANESIQLYRLIIAEQRQFPELGELLYRVGPEPILQQLSAYLAELHAKGILNAKDIDSSSRLFLDMLKGDQHLRCVLGLQIGLSDTEKQRLIETVVSLFLKGHGYEA
ncbi:TetR/AcrR family transcriptional regulator [Methylomonas koyamae]|uniref:TetR family transcriptional regulator n=1 Tax=Methylomonas koyamae TaxID=702114 RepID=A0AA91DD91_9GAMM|nr:TetR/AcrR family transcriptional regulator [Methylomonas koyamae]OAI25786.1 TetR family transcriptional regulator [Methylomonas koyamae]